MSHIKPLSETPENVTLSRADFDSILEELEDAEDRMAVLEDCLLDMKPEQDRYLLSMADQPDYGVAGEAGTDAC
jgi:hypothetical protein